MRKDKLQEKLNKRWAYKTKKAKEANKRFAAFKPYVYERLPDEPNK